MERHIKKILIITGHLVFIRFLAEVLTGVLIKGLAGVIPEDLQLPAYRLYFAGSLLAVGVVYGSKLLGFEIAGFFAHRAAWGRLFSGMLAAFGSVAAIILLSAWLGTYNISVGRLTFKPGQMMFFFGLFILVAFAEELLHRGIIFRLTEKHYSGSTAIILSALTFSLMHLFNKGVTLLAFLNIFLLGLLMAEKVAATGSLWWPVGFHFAWNAMEGLGFSLPVSGLAVPGILNVVPEPSVIKSPFWGAEFGPEGSIVTTAVAVIILMFRNIRKG
ncbi:CPBP family intramembrane glutamic endopeptidase [Thermincola potens]|uniref:CPBP family intramembrane glutamic endopeptidase n=1 Tax=Thermincola potens TaxID=863643 RepID=UPI00030D104A|nr:type II CAAX endopeptidase family protein [Thermincola potens]